MTRRARPCRQRTVQPPGGAGSAVPQLEPGHRPPAAPPPAPPGGQLRDQLQPPAAFRVTAAGRSCGVPPPPRSVTSTRTMPSPALTATVTVSPAAPEPQCRTLLPNSSLTSSATSSPHGCPGRAPRPRTHGQHAPAPPARQASRLPDTPRPSAHPPSRPPSSRKSRGPRPDTRGCTPDSAANVKPGNAAGTARPWPSVKQPTVRTDREGTKPVRYASVDTATQRPAALQGDTPRDREETPR